MHIKTIKKHDYLNKILEMWGITQGFLEMSVYSF